MGLSRLGTFEAGIVEKLEPGSEMLFGAGEIASPISRLELDTMDAPQIVGATLTKAKIESLVGE